MNEFLFNDKPFDIVRRNDTPADEKSSSQYFISELLREVGKIRIEIIKMQKRMQAGLHQTATVPATSESPGSSQMPTALKYLENILREVRGMKPELVTLKNDVENDLVDEYVKELLPVVDSFQRVFDLMKNIEDDPQMTGWLSGIKQIYNSLILAFRKYDVTEIEALGKPFDPRLHAAIGTVKDPDKPDGTIIKVDRIGFIRKGYPIRFPEVIVVRNID